MSTGFKSAQVGGSKVPSTITSYVAFVDPVRAGMASLADVQSVRVYSDAAKTTELARHVVSASQLFVNIPSCTTTFTIYLDWDGARADYANTDTYGRNNTYPSGYKGVYHLEDANDSTSNAYTLTNTGAVPFNAYKIGNGADFTPNDSLNNNSILSATSYPKSFSGIFNIDNTTGDQAFFALGDGTTHYYSFKKDSGGNLVFRSNNTTLASNLDTGITAASNTDYHVVVVQHSATSASVYVNGTKTNTTGTTETCTVSQLFLGYLGRSSVWYMDGQADEFRVFSGTLADAWVTTEYNNLMDEATFWPTWTTVGNDPPTVTTSAVSSIASTTATGNGDVTSDGGSSITERGVCWKTSTGPTTADTKATSAGTTGAFTASMTSLTAGTTYYVKAYAINAEGTSYGSEVSFTTDAAPTVTTQAVSAVAETTATGNGNVTADNGDAITERGVCWNTLTNPTTANSKATSAGTTGAFTASMTGLTGSTLYYVRAYAINGVGTSYGTEVTFTTAAGDVAPTVTTQAVSSIAVTTAIGNGDVTSDGGDTITERGVCWNTSGTPTTASSKATSVGTTGAYTASITGLSGNTLYYVRAYAINGIGTSYGTEVTFTTDTSPTVTTQAVSSIFDTSATGNGNVTSDGGDTITERGVCWKTSTGPTTADFKATSAGTTGAFTASISSLTPSTTYYVKAYAINSLGTSYGSEVSFTTTATPSIGDAYHPFKYWNGTEWVRVS